jgi:dTDP-4-dehydrorhamnose 3,5-epimerase
MRFEQTDIEDLVLVLPERHVDTRGYFARVFCADEFAAAGLTSLFPQTSVSFNVRAGTVRGMHYQTAPHAETKLVRCIRGAILDVVVDLRPDRPSFRQWRAFELTPGNAHALYIPEGFAHGFQTLSDETEVAYAITPAFVPDAGAGLRPDDPALAIRWPLPISVISEKDLSWPLLQLADV